MLEKDYFKGQTRTLNHTYDQKKKSLKVKIQIKIAQWHDIWYNRHKKFSMKLQEGKQTLLWENGKITVKLEKLHNQGNLVSTRE